MAFECDEMARIARDEINPGELSSLSRRAFVRGGLMASAAGATALSGLRASPGWAAIPRDYVAQVARIPRIFCTALLPPQLGQERVIANYPIAIVPQDIRPPSMIWRNTIRRLNPEILMLGYLNVNTESLIPGPGHDRFRKVQAAWARSPGGGIRVAMGRKIYDPRQPAWREALLEAVGLTLRSYPYDGLFLDNCTVFTAASPFEPVRQEMRNAMQGALLQLRRLLPNIILVGNTRYNWRGLNGQMNENRQRDWPIELSPYIGQHAPRMDLVQLVTSKPRPASLQTDRRYVKAQMDAVHKYGAFFGVAHTYQQVLWYDFFNELRPPMPAISG